MQIAAEIAFAHFERQSFQDPGIFIQRENDYTSLF